MRSHWSNFFLTVLLALALFAGLAGSAYAQHPGFSNPGSRQGGTGGSGLIPVEANVDGGAIPIGATGQVVILFRNEGTQPVETGAINLYPSSTVSATVSLNQCASEPLPAGAECAMALSVKGLQAGPWRVEMLMRHSGRTRLVTATISGQVDASGEGAERLSSDVEAIPNEVAFGTLSESQTLVEPVILRNITSNPINIKDIYIDSTAQSGFRLKADCTVLQAGQACIATVSWSPQIKGPSSGVLVIKHDGPAALASIVLKGEYAPSNVSEADIFPEAIPGKGLLVSSRTNIDFGSGIVSASTITMSLVNAGDVPLKIKDIVIAGQDNGLSFKGDGCIAGTILQPIEACPLTVSWSPTRVGALLDDIQVIHDGTRGVLVIPVRGTADTVVSQDQKAILLSQRQDEGQVILDGSSREEEPQKPKKERESSSVEFVSSSVQNPASVLDGLKITSFAPTRAIVNGPGGSRILFDNEEVLLGGIPWNVDIQKNGIEFNYQGQRVLLLFDRSLSSTNRITGQASGGDGGGQGNGI